MGTLVWISISSDQFLITESLHQIQISDCAVSMPSTRDICELESLWLSAMPAHMIPAPFSWSVSFRAFWDLL